METVTKYVKSFEQIIWIFMVINPLLDLVYGVQVYLLNSQGGMIGSFQVVDFPTISISLVVRMLMAVLMAIYLLIRRDKKEIFTGVCIIIAFVLSVMSEILRGVSYSIADDIIYIVRFGFNVMTMFVFAQLLMKKGEEREAIRRRLENVLCWTLFVASMIILIPYFLKIGFYTYADPWGIRGCRGFYYAGNDAAALMMMLQPAVICAFLRSEKWKLITKLTYLATVGLGVTAMIILGTKTSYVSVAFVLVAIAVYAVGAAVIKKDFQLLGRYILVAVTVGIIFGAVSIVTRNEVVEAVQASSELTSSFVETQGVEKAVFSGRSVQLGYVIALFKRQLPLAFFFGLGRGSQTIIIEMDIFEVFFYYGLVGMVLMLWIYLKNGIQFLLTFIRHFSLTTWCTMTSLLLCCGYLVLAGHTLFSVTSGFYFALLIVYGRVFGSPEDSKISIA